MVAAKLMTGKYIKWCVIKNSIYIFQNAELEWYCYHAMSNMILNGLYKLNYSELKHLYDLFFNSSAPGRCDSNLKKV